MAQDTENISHIIGDNNIVIQGVVNSHIVINSVVREKDLPYHLTQVPERLSRTFIGRSQDLEFIRQSLQEAKMGNALLIKGMGGIGKSALTQQYVKESQANYDHIVYIEIDSVFEDTKEAMVRNNEAFLRAFLWNASLRRNLGFDFKDELLTADKLEVLFNILQNLKGRNLLVIDNVSAVIKRYDNILPKVNWSILLTSRQSIGNFQQYELANLPPSDAIALFYKHYFLGRNDEVLLEIIQTLFYHTLTIQLLAKTAEARKWDLEYLKNVVTAEKLNFKKSAKVELPDEEQEMTLIEHLLKRFAIQLEVNAQSLLRLFSVMPSVVISVQNLSQWLQATPEEETKIFEGIQHLVKNGWLAEHVNGILCHPVIRFVGRIQLKPTVEDCKKLIQHFREMLQVNESIGDHGIYKLNWIIYGDTLLEGLQEDHKLLADLSDKMGWIYRDLKNYTQSLSYELRSVAINERLQPGNEFELAIAYGNLALTYKRLGDSQKALDYNLKTITIREQILHPLDATLAAGYNNLGTLYLEIGNLSNAFTYIKKGMDIRTKIFDENNLEVAVSYVSMSAYLFKTKAYADALIFSKKALTIREKKLQKAHPNLRYSYRNVAVIYMALGNTQKAAKYYSKLIATFNENKDEDQGSLGTLGESYSQIAVLYLHMNRFEEALQYNLKSLPLIDKTYDRQSVEWALARHNLAATLCELQRFSEAMPYIEQALSVYKQKLPAEHDYFVKARNWRARIMNGIKAV